MPQSQIFNMPNSFFNAIPENKILTKNYEFTIPLVQLPLSVSLVTLVRVV